MLVLSRRSNESVVVGGRNGIEQLLKVTVLQIGAGRVRLGFEVADDVPVHRSEVWERLCAFSLLTGTAHSQGKPAQPTPGEFA